MTTLTPNPRCNPAQQCGTAAPHLPFYHLHLTSTLSLCLPLHSPPPPTLSRPKTPPGCICGEPPQPSNHCCTQIPSRSGQCSSSPSNRNPVESNVASPSPPQDLALPQPKLCHRQTTPSQSDHRTRKSCLPEGAETIISKGRKGRHTERSTPSTYRGPDAPTYIRRHR